MSAALATTPVVRTVGSSVTRGLVASTRAELLRLRRWPALWVLLGVWTALNLSFVYVFNYVAYRTGDTSGPTEGIPAEALLADVLPAGVPLGLVGGTPLFGGAIVMILGALAVGSGYGWGTWKTVLTQGPGRATAFGGTLVALAIVVVGLVLSTVGIDLAAANILAAVESEPLGLPPLGELAEATGAAVLVLGMWASVGVLLGVLARSPALAVGLGLVWSLVVENLLRGVSGLIDGLSAATDHLPGTAAGSLVGALGGTSESGAGGDGTPGVLTILDGTTATWVLLAYLVGVTALAVVLVRRRDLA